MKTCPFCDQLQAGAEIQAYYLNQTTLVESIQLKHPAWSPDNGGCQQCLEDFYRQFSTQRKVVASPEDPTVIITSNHLINAATPDERDYCFIMIHGPNFGKKYGFNNNTLIIGRSDNAEIQVPGENVSRQHAKVEALGTEVVITDLDSTNGTFVNTRRITKHSLVNGDLILVGNSIMKFISGSNLEAQYYEEIYRLATIDGLTKAYNKLFFLGKLEEEFNRAKRYERHLSLIIFDFDLFSELNNKFGHMAGDYVLRTVSKMILMNIRKEDVLGRYGGEEFALLLPEIAKQDARRLANKIRTLVENTPFNHDDRDMQVTISLGIASTLPTTPSGKALLEEADQALYLAKKSGRNCVRSLTD